MGAQENLDSLQQQQAAPSARRPPLPEHTRGSRLLRQGRAAGSPSRSRGCTRPTFATDLHTLWCALLGRHRSRRRRVGLLCGRSVECRWRGSGDGVVCAPGPAPRIPTCGPGIPWCGGGGKRGSRCRRWNSPDVRTEKCSPLEARRRPRRQRSAGMLRPEPTGDPLCPGCQPPSRERTRRAVAMGAEGGGTRGVL